MNVQEISKRNQSRKTCQAKTDITELLSHLSLSDDVILSVFSILQDHDLNIDGTPPMMLPEAINSLIYRKLKEVGAFGDKPTVRYKKKKKPNAEGKPVYKRIEIKKGSKK